MSRILCPNPECRFSLPPPTRWCPECGSSLAVRPGVFLGEHLVRERIGVGSMGEVWRAEHPQRGVEVAIKVLSLELFQDERKKAEVLARFQREARAVSQIQKERQHFVEVFDFGEAEDGRPYFVMELLKGAPLARRLEAGPLPFAEILELIGQCCRALGAVHEHELKIVHRDIKPDNLFLVPRPGGPLVKILDFGLAKLEAKGGLTRTNSALGTPRYMCPEQWQNAKQVDHRADIYALGLILFEMICGRGPFAEAGDRLLEVMRSHVLTPPPPPSALAPWRRLPPGVDQAVLRALAKQPSDRQPSCAALFEELSRAAAPLAQEDEADLAAYARG